MTRAVGGWRALHRTMFEKMVILYESALSSLPSGFAQNDRFWQAAYGVGGWETKSERTTTVNVSIQTPFFFFLVRIRSRKREEERENVIL